MKKIMTFISLSLSLSFGSAYAETSLADLEKFSIESQASALKAFEKNKEVQQIISTAQAQGCKVMSATATLIGNVSYGFSAETMVFAIERLSCDLPFAESSIKTISGLVTLKGDDTGKDSSKVIVNPVDLNGLVLQHQQHKPTN